MKSNKILLPLVVAGLSLTSCQLGGEKVEPMEASVAMNKIAAAVSTTSWKGAKVEQTANLSEETNVTSTSGSSNIASKVSLTDTIKAGISFNQDELAKLKAGEDADLENIMKASLEVALKLETEASMDLAGQTATSINAQEINGSGKYGKATISDITSDFLVGNFEYKTSTTISGQTMSQNASISLGAYNIASLLASGDSDIGSVELPNLDFSFTAEDIQASLNEFVASYGDYITITGNSKKINISANLTPELSNKILESSNQTVTDLTSEGSLVFTLDFSNEGAFTGLYFEMSKVKVSFTSDSASSKLEGDFKITVTESKDEVAGPSQSDVTSTTVLLPIKEIIGNLN